MTEISDAKIIELYAGGMSLKSLATLLGRSIRRPLRVVKKAGILRPWGGSGPEHSQWTGRRLPATGGYWRQWISPDDPLASMRDHQGYIREHRLFMARKIGRPLLPSETVHHIDGDKGHNVPENLELRQGKHGKNVVMCCLDCGSRNIGHAKLGEH